MKHKVSELEGAPLNAAVAMAEGLRGGHLFQKYYSPSTEWAVGGPIIERERITVVSDDTDNSEYVRNKTTGEWELNGPRLIERSWAAGVGEGFDTGGDVILNRPLSHGPTYLVAAMRAYVASKFGDEVELPE